MRAEQALNSNILLLEHHRYFNQPMRICRRGRESTLQWAENRRPYLNEGRSERGQARRSSRRPVCPHWTYVPPFDLLMWRIHLKLCV